MIPKLPNRPLHRSLAEIPEAELVSRLIADPRRQRSLFGIVGMPNDPRIVQRVGLEDAPGDYEGDVDILLVPQGQPNLATAVEVKRIKVGASAFAIDQPNKLQEYDKGVQQANRLAEIGFAQVYLYVIVAVDSRFENDGRYTYDDGMSPTLRSTIMSRFSLQHLEPTVGLVIHELVQSMDHPPLEMEAYGGSLKRIAARRTQPAELTEWIAQL